MKAMILKKTAPIENSPLEYTEIPKPEPQKDEIRIKLRACGVCHTDLHEIEGDLPMMKKNLIPGHEIIGIIDKIGENVDNFKIGDRVGVPWLYSSCGTCKYCKRSQENLCNDAKFTGYHVNGGYAEYMIASSNYAYLIPEIFSDAEAAPLMCAGVIGYRSIKMSQIKPGETLGLFGFGASAHIVIQIAKYWNCDVFVFTRSKNHQEHARKLGASWVGTSKESPPKKIDRAISFATRYIDRMLITSSTNAKGIMVFRIKRLALWTMGANLWPFPLILFTYINASCLKSSKGISFLLNRFNISLNALQSAIAWEAQVNAWPKPNALKINFSIKLVSVKTAFGFLTHSFTNWRILSIPSLCAGVREEAVC